MKPEQDRTEHSSEESRSSQEEQSWGEGHGGKERREGVAEWSEDDRRGGLEPGKKSPEQGSILMAKEPVSSLGVQAAGEQVVWEQTQSMVPLDMLTPATQLDVQGKPWNGKDG